MKDLKRVRKTIQGNNDKLISKLSGKEYDELVNVIQENWDDDNSRKYLEKLLDAINILKKEVEKNNNKIQSILDSNIKDKEYD